MTGPAGGRGESLRLERCQMKQILGLYDQIDPDVLACLESVCLHRGRTFALAERYLSVLLDLELLECAPGQGWRPSWLGRGVVNWHRQRREASLRGLRASQPRPGENGDQPGPVCNEFRELLFSGVYCWCGRPSSEHPHEVVRTASRMLAYYDRNRNLGPLSGRVTGRSLVHLAGRLPGDLRHLLQLIGADGATLAELLHKLNGCFDLLPLQLGLDYLADLDLVYLDEGELVWFPSWDGMGLKIWLQEQFVHMALHEPLPEVRPGENGHTVLPEACDKFRPLLSLGGGSCWCGHAFAAHPE